MKEELKKGYTCTCGKEHQYTMYVFAHWDVPLTHTCDCGKKWTILRGHAVEEE